MRAAVFVKTANTGSQARKLRAARRLTQRELAELTGVSLKDIALFERNLPVALDVKRRLLKELWAGKARAAVPA